MEKTLTSLKTYRYEVYPCKGESKKALYILHGYGQLAKFFIRKFEVLRDHFHIIAPEGMHRFYLQGSSGRVGASWMTKEAREEDISDNLHWLNDLDRTVSKEMNFNERHLLGFSQGGATAARWYASTPAKFESLTLWACVFPPDLDMDAELQKFHDMKNGYFVIGEQDQFYNSLDQEKLSDFYKKLGFETLHFNGDHNIDADVLSTIYESNV